MQSMATQDGGPVDHNGAEESLWLRDTAAILRFSHVLFYTVTCCTAYGPGATGSAMKPRGAAGALPSLCKCLYDFRTTTELPKDAFLILYPCH